MRLLNASFTCIADAQSKSPQSEIKCDHRENKLRMNTVAQILGAHSLTALHLVNNAVTLLRFGKGHFPYFAVRRPNLNVQPLPGDAINKGRQTSSPGSTQNAFRTPVTEKRDTMLRRNELCQLAGSVKPLVLVKHVTAPVRNQCQLFLHRPFTRVPFSGTFLPFCLPRKNHVITLAFESDLSIWCDCFRKRDEYPSKTSLIVSRDRCTGCEFGTAMKIITTKYARIILIYDKLEDNDPSSITGMLRRYEGRG